MVKREKLGRLEVYDTTPIEEGVEEVSTGENISNVGELEVYETEPIQKYEQKKIRGIEVPKRQQPISKGVNRLASSLRNVGMGVARGASSVYKGAKGAVKNVADTYYESEAYLNKREVERAEALAKRDEARLIAEQKRLELEKQRAKSPRGNPLTQTRGTGFNAGFPPALMPSRNKSGYSGGFHPALISRSSNRGIQTGFHPALTSRSSGFINKGFPPALMGGMKRSTPVTKPRTKTKVVVKTKIVYRSKRRKR